MSKSPPSDAPPASTASVAADPDTLLPSIRAVEVYPIVQGSQKFIALRDPMGYAKDPVLIPQAAALLLAFFDGKHTIRQLQEEIQRRLGQLLLTEQVLGFMTQLDQSGYLDSEGFRRLQKETDDAFHSQPVRPYCHAGLVYPAEPKELRKQFQEYFAAVRPQDNSGVLRGVVVPHIDIRFAGQAYAFAYASLARGPLPRRFVILGTAHQSPPNTFVVTRKAYDTPLGPVPTDQDYVQFLETELGPEIYADEWVHRTEHSVEFQAVFLKYLFPLEPGLKIVPILCSSMHEWVLNGHLPGESERIGRFIAALQEADRQFGPTVYIAGADLAHMGVKFGDPFKVNESIRRELDILDREMLTHAERVDGDAFFRNIQGEKDKRRICGLSPIYTLLKAVTSTVSGSPALKGHLLKYDQAAEEATGSVVSFASLAIYQES
ncbi:MAG: AmmeMemoRadiSam system protein B [Nitrospirae bacterium]|nr:AmmeMemoRadiSam system protein B [Nitrospirota bacterium]